MHNTKVGSWRYSGTDGAIVTHCVWELLIPRLLTSLGLSIGHTSLKANIDEEFILHRHK